ncbi:SH3 domain-containing protein [Alphaproteobacteria bacterium KMM 3653]|uniref:SH3 domain-containing protein n=1 Tax=Harenicola maris TaxID=2841044 RepID=A0AAP2CRK3_9RHOB|nr:SH3 domain-containing protein [Harenicola maris]
MNMTLALLALMFGAMVAVGEGPRVASVDEEDDLAVLAQVLEDNGVSSGTVDPDKAMALTATTAADEAVEVEVARATLPLLDTSKPAATATEAQVTQVSAPAGGLITTAVVLGNRVNVRSGPSTGNPVITKVVKGQEVEVLSYTDNGWAEILVKGDIGFMSGDFLRENADG